MRARARFRAPSSRRRPRRAHVPGIKPDERKIVRRRPEDPGPAVRDRRQVPDKVLYQRLERSLNGRRRRLLRRELELERDVAPATGNEPAVGKLLPVVEPLARVVRPLVEELGQRLGGDDLTAGRTDDVVELGDETTPVAVGRDHDVLRIELVQ